MTIYTACTVNLAEDAIKVRWQEPYVTSGLNQKTLGQLAKGVFAGFTVVPGGVGTFEVLLQVDPALGFSGANVLDVTTSKYCVTVIQNSAITVDLASVANGTVYLTLDAQYQIGRTSAAQVKVVDAAEVATNTNLVLLAKVNVPATAPILPAHINMGYRLSVGESVPTEARPRSNLINNPSMGTGDLRGWDATGFDVAQASTDFPRTGSYSQELAVTVPGQPWIDSSPMPVISGRKYRASAWLRSTGVAPISGTGAELQVIFLDVAGAPIGAPMAVESTFGGGGTTYVQRQAEVTAPALAAKAVVRVQYLPTTGGTLYVDDIEFSTHEMDSLVQSAVFGGGNSNADAHHRHSSGLQDYGGGDAWADGTTNPPTTVEAQLDKIITDLAGVNGAEKIGNAPSKIQANTFTQPNTFTSAASNTDAVIATGNGTGAGVSGTGGATGVGVKGDGGSGTPTFSALNRGAGIQGTGGSGGGVGVYGRGGSTSTIGSTSQAYPNSGVLGVGSGTSGSGVVGISAAVSGGFIHGGKFIGADGYDAGGLLAIGSGAGHGIVAIGGTTGNALQVSAGHAAFTGGNPLSTTGFTNTVTPTNILKAWVRVNYDTGVATYVSGFNVLAHTVTNDINLATGEFSITLASNVAQATRAVTVQQMSGLGIQLIDLVGTPSANVVTVKAYAVGVGSPANIVAMDLTANDSFNFAILVYGPQ